jgi:hypothetical protein
MHQRAIIIAATSALALAAVILLSPKEPVQAQTPNLSVAGAIYSGTSAVNATPGPVPPCYIATGSACTGTFHILTNSGAIAVELDGSCSNDSWCTLNSNADISFPNIAFVSNRYSCSVTTSTAYQILLTVNTKTTTGFDVQVYNNSGSSIPNGTDLGVSYACEGE